MSDGWHEESKNYLKKKRQCSDAVTDAVSFAWMTLFFSLSWLYHVFDNFKQKPWTPRSNFNHHTTRWVVPMFLSCFTRSRSRVGWFFFGPDRSIWIYRVIRWNHGNHHPKQLLLNFWRIQKKTPEKFARRSYSWFVRGVSLQQMGTHGVQMWQFFRVCMFFFFDMFLHQQRLQTFFSYTMHKCVSFCWMQKQNFPHFSPWNMSVASASRVDRQALFDALFGRAELCDGVEFLEGNLVAKWFLGPKKHATWWPVTHENEACH